MIFISLLIESITIIFAAFSIIPLLKLNKINRKIRIFRIKERAKLTEDQIKKQQAYLKIHMSNFIVASLNILIVCIIIFLVLLGYSLHNLFEEPGNQTFILISLLALVIILYALFAQKSVAKGQAIRKKYIAKYPDNPLKFFIYPDDLLIQYSYVFKRAGILVLIIGILAFIVGVIG
ncbi:hypothetical protein [Liquorilactobacillus satsumensis]|uniref:hypothetical protein n=1 Tax=Liquorilactobacillus TaxID=2767888 RepID=UPI0006CFBDE0|nr:hypothetical protein [Liquorilactobacillus satsumensis]MCP9329218.1 hypothetical protein [Liquorilactobacillus satsumensis]